MAAKKSRLSEVADDSLPPVKQKPTQLQDLKKITAAFGAWKPAQEVLLEVKSVPTCFPQYDFTTRVGGHPLERVVVVTGPSNHGKTAFVLGLLASFAERGHYAGLADAERTTTFGWAKQMMRGFASDPHFLAIRPDSFEQMVQETRKFASGLTEKRTAGDVPPETGGLIVVDSIRKLVPKKLMEILHKETVEKGNIDGMSGRAAQLKAALNAAWLDELVPLMADSNCTIVLIAREVDDPNADVWSKRAHTDFKITGGKALVFDSSLVLRVSRANFVQEKFGEGEDSRSKVYGERHRVSIIKTKVGGKEEKIPTCFFHTSNGVLTPAGFDRARDVIDLGVRFKVIAQKGSWFSFAGKQIACGIHRTVVELTSNKDLLLEVEAAVRDQFGEQEVEVEDLETGEVE